MNRPNSTNANFASCLEAAARKTPHARAVVCPVARDSFFRITYTQLTFRQLCQEADCLAAGLSRAGIGRGTKTLLLLPVCLDTYPILFALFQIGAIPVFASLQWNSTKLQHCLQVIRPDAVICDSLKNRAHPGLMKALQKISTIISLKKGLFQRGLSLKDIRRVPWTSPPLIQITKTDPAAIFLTAGVMGPPKAVLYTHEELTGQVRQMRGLFPDAADHLLMNTIPHLAHIGPALGIPTVLPRPAAGNAQPIDPQTMVEIIINQGVTHLFTDMDRIKRISELDQATPVHLSSIQHTLLFGDSLFPQPAQRFRKLLKANASIHFIYGAVEATPMLKLDAGELFTETHARSTRGYGTCIGRPEGEEDIGLIQISDNPIEHFSESRLVSQGEIGELIVRGEFVSKRYHSDAKQDLRNKIRDGNQTWHRTGDLCWMDKNGRLWFCGRLQHRIHTQQGLLYPVPCEAIFNAHPSVFRSVLVGIGPREDQEPVICIQLSNHNLLEEEQVRKDLLTLAQKHIITEKIKIFYFHPDLPVINRSGFTIDRKKVADWAAMQIKKPRPE